MTHISRVALVVLTVLCGSIGCKELITPSPSSPRERGREREPRKERRESPAPLPPMARVKNAHPKLLATAEDFDRVREMTKSDPIAREWLDKLKDRAIKITRESPPKYAKGGMLAISRTSYLRIVTLGVVYRCTGDEKFAQRAVDEMTAVSKFPDWQPDDFLATAEMTAAVSLGYDWLFDTISAADRKTIVDGIMNNGMRAGLDAYKDGDGWTGVRHNWNFVCNGGLILGALAISDDAPKQSAQMLKLSRESMANAMESFAPDGGWEEGPAYWNYATRYATFVMAALETATGSDGGLSKMPGFNRTGMYRLAMEGASGKLFNYGDCGEGTASAPQLFWMANRFKQPVYAAFELRDARKDPSAIDLLWYPLVAPVDANAFDRTDLPTTLRFENVEVVAMRNAWNDRDATYVALKGGSNESHHGHLDLGSFVLDALGQRWAIDLGPDSYSLPGYFDDERRWKYYRTRSEGHNTLTIERGNQDNDARAPIVGFSGETSDGRSGYSVVDLTRAYKKVERVQRGVMMFDDGHSVLLQDEIDGSSAASWTWHFHTRADVDLEGSTATLKQGGRTLRAEIVSPAGAKFVVEPVAPPAPQAQDTTAKDLMIRIAVKRDEPTTIAVIFTPVVEDKPEARTRPAKPRLKLRQLADWSKR